VSLTLNNRHRGSQALIPFAMAGAYLALLVSKKTRPFAVLMAREDYPIELATFLVLMIGGIFGVRLALRLRRGAYPAWVVAFYAVFSVFLLLIAMEEISWGQWFFFFKTPEPIRRINRQGEFNLHNLDGVGGHTEYLRLAFGAGGLIGLALGRIRAGAGADTGAGSAGLRALAVEPRLWSWFVVITALAASDLYCDFHDSETRFAKAMDVMSELVELMIAIAALLYLWTNHQRLRPKDETPFALPGLPGSA
jgi:hypothetical protein